ncbi:RNA polymerase, sigma-24 subunit, ECF subfamily [Parafrankia sp. EUN1f]|nr:RNA polymerase, sigma-24 subunit, ECF subfamily [Parafrankia sp. EUN1f]
MSKVPSGATAVDVSVLVDAARAGDEDALTDLISVHLPLVYGVVGKALNNHADVDDVVQETMIRVVRGLPGLREPDRFRSWVLAIAHREVQLHLRRPKPTSRFDQQDPGAEPADPAGDFAERTVTELVLAGQRRNLVEAARWLDDDDRRLLSLWWQEAVGELSRAELAAALSVGTRHASVRLRRMKVQLEATRMIAHALRASPRCRDLDGLIRPWNGHPDPLWRKRLSRHVRGCPHCGRYERELVAPEQLLYGVAALPAAIGLAAAMPATASTAPAAVWGVIRDVFSSKVAAGGAAVTVALGGAFTYAVVERPLLGTEAVPVIVSSPTKPGSGMASGAAQSFGVAGSSAAPSSAALAPPASGANGVVAGDIYVAPDGSDGGAGTIEEPLATLSRAVAVVRPGQTIVMRGGLYRPAEPVEIRTSGSAQQRITLTNYGAERPVIDAGRVPADKWMITQSASYWTVRGLEIKNSRSHAYVCLACQYNVFQQLVIHDNVRSSLTLRDDGTIGNQVLDCDFFNNRDPADPGGVGTGVAVKFGFGEGNLLRGNRSFNNANDGFDFGSFASPVTVEHNWAYGNGINRWGLPSWDSNATGFRFGGGAPVRSAAHVARHNAAWDNVGSGFDDGGNTGAMQMINNTAFRNGGIGFKVPRAAAVLRNNVSVGNASQAVVGEGAELGRNTWQAGDGGAVRFRSTDPRNAQGERALDGTLAATGFLVTGTDLGAAMSAGG